MVLSSLIARITFCFLLVASSVVHANVLFEGYAKILSGTVHTGYIIQKFELDKSGNFVATSYTRTGPSGGDITESLKATATKGLEPISFSYTSTVGKDIKIIDATFKKGKMVAKVTKGSSTQTVEKPVEKGTFLSSFLIYLMLQSQDGLKQGTKYTYKAIAEEDPEIAMGESFIDSQETYKGQTVFKVLNTFKGTKFSSYVTPNGEILMTKSPAQGVSTEVVANRADAIGSFPFKESSLKILFGDVPKGVTNAIAKSAPAESNPTNVQDDQKMKELTKPAPPTGSKGEGVPGGKGLILKGDPKNNPKGKTDQ